MPIQEHEVGLLHSPVFIAKVVLSSFSTVWLDRAGLCPCLWVSLLPERDPGLGQLLCTSLYKANIFLEIGSKLPWFSYFWLRMKVWTDVKTLLVACNPNACRASGRGLQPKGVRIRETADFRVDTKAAGSGDLSITVKGPSKCCFHSHLSCDFSLTLQLWHMDFIPLAVLIGISGELCQRIEAVWTLQGRNHDLFVMSALEVGKNGRQLATFTLL